MRNRIEVGGDTMTKDLTLAFDLRVGEYRVLFKIEDERVIIYRVKHRKEVYR